MRAVQWGCLLFYSVLSEDLIPFQSVKTSLTWHAKNTFFFVVLKECNFVTPVYALLFYFLALLHIPLDMSGFFWMWCSRTGTLHEEHSKHQVCGAQNASGWCRVCGTLVTGTRAVGLQGFQCLECINIWISLLQFPGFLQKNRRLFHL